MSTHKHPHNELIWALLWLLLMSFILITNLHSQTAPTETVLERVIPRACLQSVQLKDPAQCRVIGVELAPTSECRGPIGGPMLCSSFLIKLDGPGCTYLVTHHKDCENINVKKVPSTSRAAGVGSTETEGRPGRNF